MTAQSRARIAAVFSIFIFIIAQYPVRADVNPSPSFPCPTIDGKSDLSAPLASGASPPWRQSTRTAAASPNGGSVGVDCIHPLYSRGDAIAPYMPLGHLTRLPAALHSTATSSSDPTDKSTDLIAQANTGTEVANIAAVGAAIGKKQKNEPLITDSLWGNLILDMSYQRDPEIKKLIKRLNLVNLGTMGTITAVTGGTLAQGIIALSVINPPPPQHDSYLPLGIGVGMSGLTLVVFAGRAILNHCLMTRMRNRQFVIKHKVETILAQFESSHGENTEAQTELTGLIGERAANEWAQLWRSSNVVASMNQPHISALPAEQNTVNIR